MSKALNLTDMLWQRNGAAGQDRAKEAGSAQGAARAAAKRPRADFIPPQPAPAAQGADKGGSVKTFRERVKESQERIARREHAFFKQPGRPESSQAETAKSRPAKAQDAEAAGRHEGAVSSRPHGPSRAATRKSDSKADPAEAADTESAAGAAGGANAQGVRGLRPETRRHPAEGREDAPRDGHDALDRDALEDRLAELGIEATPEQLRDPAFLAGMLWQIDDIPAELPLFPENGPVEDGLVALPPMPGIPASETDPTALATDGDAMAGAPANGDDTASPALPDGTAATAAQAMNVAPVAPAANAAAPEAIAAAADILARGADAETGIATRGTAPAATAGDTNSPIPGDFDWTSVEEPERDAVAALLREKLSVLADDPGMRSGPGTARPQTADLPGAVQLARAGADQPLIAAVPLADPVLGDPDRLRVLQNAGVEDALSRENALLALERGLEADPSAEPGDGEDGRTEGDTAGNLFRGAVRDDSGESRADLSGRRGDAEARAEAFGGRETAAPAKESGATAFQSALESVRASEARLAQARTSPPHAHAPAEPTVLAQIARKLSALGPRSAEEIRIQLEPEHLGKVRIAIELRGEGLTARISVENDAVRQMVDQNLASLKESLESQGVKIQGMEVSVEQRHASLFNPDGSNAREFFRRRGQEPAGAEAGAEAAAEASEADTGRRMGYNTMEYIA